MALFAAVVMFLAVLAVVVIVIISDNKKELAKANGQSKITQEINRVYDGIPIAKCYLCGGRGVIVAKTNNKDILFNARCRDCNRTLFKDDGGPDLGYVLTEWNKWNEDMTDITSSYRYDYANSNGKGRNGWNPEMHKPIKLRS